MFKRNTPHENRIFTEKSYYKYENMIFRISLDILRDKHLAEDAAQETACKIVKYCDRVKLFNSAEEKNYIAAIARNTAINVYNKHNKLIYENYEDSEEVPDASVSSNPDEYVITNESVDMIIAELKSLGEKYSDPLILSRVYKYSIKEISDILGVPERTINHRIKRGTEKLKARFKNGDKNE